MLINIEDELFYKMLNIVKGRNLALYNQIKGIQPLEDIKQVDTLSKAREIKTNRIKENIKQSLTELLQANIQPSKYKVHKQTSISYITLNKYYDDILNEINNKVLIPKYCSEGSEVAKKE